MMVVDDDYDFCGELETMIHVMWDCSTLVTSLALLGHTEYTNKLMHNQFQAPDKTVHIGGCMEYQVCGYMHSRSYKALGME